MATSQTTSEKYKSRGNEFFKSGQYKEALEQYTEALKIDPENAAVLYSNRSITYAKLENYECALADALKCTQIKPQWAKGFLRKATALEHLGRHEEVMLATAVGFKVCGEGRVKRAFVERWFVANQKVNRLPKGAIELPRGIHILSKDYLLVLAHVMRSLHGEQPLNHSVLEQCLYSCADQLEKVLRDFGEPVSTVVKEWAKYLPHEVFPYAPNTAKKDELVQLMFSRTEALVQFFNKEVDPALYPILRPILGLIVILVLNRTNILCEANTGHLAAELMNRALLPLFEKSVLCTDEFHSMYIGRLCAVLDSFVGRGYNLAPNEVTSVQRYCQVLERAMSIYPKHLPEYTKDQHMVDLCLNSVKMNILLPPTSLPPSLPTNTPMSVEVAWRVVKDRPTEVQEFIKKHLAGINSAEFLTMRDVEDLLTMTGIFLDLQDKESAVKVFTRGEQAFFRVLGHLLTTSALKLDQCAATVTPTRQLALTEAALLQDPRLLADVVLRWKCLFTEFRSHLIRQGLGTSFSSFFQWYMQQRTSPTLDTPENVEEALLTHMHNEETLLCSHALPILSVLSQQTSARLQEVLGKGEALLDYIFFSTIQENPLLEAVCIVHQQGNSPVVCHLDYSSIRRLAATVMRLLSLVVTTDRKADKTIEARIAIELSSLAKVLFPQPITDILDSGSIEYLLISPDGDISQLPLDMLPLGPEQKPLFERFSVVVLSSSRELLRRQVVTALRHSQTNPQDRPTTDATEAEDSSEQRECWIVANPNFDLQKPMHEIPLLTRIVEAFSAYVNISDGSITHCVEALQHSQEEAEYISSSLTSNSFNVQMITGNDATLSKVLSIRNPLVLHISSHALGKHGRSAFRGNFFTDMNASIALAGFNTYTKQHFDSLLPEAGTGRLPALAISSMLLLGTRLVYISTCTSAVGNVPGQEAVGNLAEAFIAAGAETVVATLWAVEDYSAAKFSKCFYDRLKVPGVRPSQALKFAKQSLQSDGSQLHWSYWGGFTCYGLDIPLLQ